MGSSPETVAKTPQQVVMEGNQARELAEQTRKSERRLKQVARGRLGKKTLLEGPRQEMVDPGAPPVRSNPKGTGAIAKSVRSTMRAAKMNSLI